MFLDGDRNSKESNDFYIRKKSHIYFINNYFYRYKDSSIYLQCVEYFRGKLRSEKASFAIV